MAIDIPVVFANSGDKTDIPEGVQPDGSVSYENGWGADYEIDPDAGGKRLEKNNFNGLFNLITVNQKEIVDQGVINHIPGKEYLINAKVRGTDGKNYISNKTTTLTPPSADWNEDGANELDIVALPNKTVPVNADKAVISDSEDSNTLKNIDLSLILNSNVPGSILPLTGYCFFNGNDGIASSIGGVVSSISRVGTGLYDVVFALTNTNILFVPMFEKNQVQGSPRALSLLSDTLTTSFAKLDRRVCDTSGSLEDSSNCGFLIYGGL